MGGIFLIFEIEESTTEQSSNATIFPFLIKFLQKILKRSQQTFQEKFEVKLLGIKLFDRIKRSKESQKNETKANLIKPKRLKKIK